MGFRVEEDSNNRDWPQTNKWRQIQILKDKILMDTLSTGSSRKLGGYEQSREQWFVGLWNIQNENHLMELLKIWPSLSCKVGESNNVVSSQVSRIAPVQEMNVLWTYGGS